MRFLRWNNRPEFGPIDADEITVAIVPAVPETVVTVAGRVTKESSPHLRARLLQLLRHCPSPTIVVDIENVTGLDTSGIATLLEVLPLARRKSVRLRLVGVCGQPRMLAEMTHLAALYCASGSEVEYK